MEFIHIVDHPLLRHSLTILRDKNTTTEEYRRHTAIVSQIMIMEATKNIPVQEINIETPLAVMTGYAIQKSIVFVPVLRAGISMLFSARDFLPWAPVGFIGLERDEETAVASE
jgi:uracil phosphoribosyltransferase